MNQQTRLKRTEHCKQKTAVGNVFVNKAKAKMAASRKTRETGRKIEWYRCPICGLYHIGGRDKRDKQR